MAQEIIEGRWDCTTCGTSGNLGRFKKCPNCGNDRGEVAFYFPDTQPVTDPNLLNLAEAGPDWTCASCSNSNIGTANFCTSCGAPRKGDEVARVETQLGELQKNPDDAEAYIDNPHADDYSSSVVYQGDKPSFWQNLTSKVSLNKWHFIIAAIFVLVFGIGYLLLRTTEVKAIMVGAEWNRTIFIEQYKTVREGDWSIPAGGRFVSSERRVHHYDQVKVGERTIPGSCHTVMTDKGNGFASVETVCDSDRTENIYDSRAVYQTWYYYDIDRWVAFRTVPTTGQRSEQNPPYWGEFELKCAGQTRIGCERESGRTQEYIIIFSNTENRENIFRHSVKESDWWLYLVEREYTLVVNAFGIQNDPLRHGQPEGKINYGESQYTNP